MMREMEWDRARHRLNLMWFACLPTAIIIVTAGLYIAVTQGHLQKPKPEFPPQFVELLPAILGFVALFGAGLARFAQKFAVRLARRGNAAATPQQTVTAAMFIILGLADAPAIIAIAFYAALQTDWITIATVIYSFIAAVTLKPDLDRLHGEAGRAQDAVV